MVLIGCVQFRMGSGSVPEEVSFEGEEHPLSDRLLRYEYMNTSAKPSYHPNGAFVLLCEPADFAKTGYGQAYGKPPEFGLSTIMIHNL